MVDEFFRMVKNAVGDDQDNNDEQDRNVRPASEDPYGDPADQEGGYGDVRSASEDPYGDPADQ